MKKIITYGTFDMLHYGHVNLLRRAKDLGDYLIVGVTSGNYDKNRGKLNVRKNLLDRIEDVKATGLADEIIIEEYEGQKIDDIQKYGVNTFVIGSDWLGKFDYLKEYCEVIYLERTKNISSTIVRNETRLMIEIGIIGSGRIAHRFIPESKFVSGVDVVGVYNPRQSSADAFCQSHELKFATDCLDEFLSKVDTVYIASPHATHAGYIRESLLAGKHVLCEKPLVLKSDEAAELYDLAKKNNLVLLEALKTAYSPGFKHLINILKSGVIGQIKDVEASFTKLVPNNSREMLPEQAGGSMIELGSYVLLPIIKLLGTGYDKASFYSCRNQADIDVFTKGIIEYPSAIASFKVGLGVKTEGNLIVSGTKGYAYVPAPWWKTEYFELRYENLNDTKKYFYRFDGDGLRYELDEFFQLIIKKDSLSSYLFSPNESIAILKLIELFRSNKNTKNIA